MLARILSGLLTLKENEAILNPAAGITKTGLM